jgi:hypothetical protein
VLRRATLALSSNESSLSQALFEACVGAKERPAGHGRTVAGRVREVAWSEEPVCRMEAGHAGRQRRSWVPSRARLRLGSFGVGHVLAVDGVADVALQ